MITKLTTLTATQRDRLMTIWLQGNLEAHPFVAASYWRDMAPLVAQQLNTATLYVATADAQIVGFAGLTNQYIAGIFVAHDYRNQGIGHALLTQLQTDYPVLTLSVYPQNQGAVKFYQRHGFTTSTSATDPDTGVPDQEMLWQRKPSTRAQN